MDFSDGEIERFINSLDTEKTTDKVLLPFFHKLKEQDTSIKNKAIVLLAKHLTYYKRGDLRRLLTIAETEADTETKVQYLIRDEMLKKFNLLSLQESEQIMLYDNNHYSFNLMELEKFISNRIEVNNENQNFLFGEIYKWINKNLQFPMRKLNFAPHIIPFKNGYCNLQTNEFTSNEAIKEVGEEWHFFYAIPHDFKIGKPPYDCPKFKKTLAKWIDEKLWWEETVIIEGKETVLKHRYRKGKRLVLINDIFEMIGLCMSLEVGFKTAFISYGEKDTGKTQLGNIIEYIIGSENMSHQELYILTERFGSNALQFRLLNLCGDMTNTTIKKTGLFNLYTGGDKSIPGEVKGGKLFDFPPTAKFWFNINIFPYVKEFDNNAFFERFLLIHFPNVYKQEKEGYKINFYEEIVNDPKEVQGIMHEALDGLIRLYERKGFRPQLKENTKHIWNYKSNPYYRFVYDYCDKDNACKIESDEIATKFMEEIGAGYSKNMITRALEVLGFPKKEFKEMMENKKQKSVWYYMGLKWKEGFEIKNEMEIDTVLNNNKGLDEF